MASPGLLQSRDKGPTTGGGRGFGGCCSLRHALAQVGVHDLETLAVRGAVPVWEQLRAAGLFDCAHSLLALEGAIRGVRCAELDVGVRAARRAHAEGTSR